MTVCIKTYLPSMYYNISIYVYLINISFTTYRQNITCKYIAIYNYSIEFEDKDKCRQFYDYNRL